MKTNKKHLGSLRLLVSTLKISGITFVSLSILLAIGLFISPKPFYTKGFITLADVQRYALSVNELTPLESENAVKPDFTNYYKQFAPSIINTVKDKLGGLLEKMYLKKPPIFTASFFKTVLDDVNKIREQKGFKNSNIVKITATPQSKFIIFGDMQAAFHSLVRDITKLKELGVIGDDLKIIPSDCYIIFLGNVPSRSPFSMEIEGLVLRLMQQNPDRVLYTKGSHESDGYWQEHTLKTELKIRAAGLTKDATPLEPEVTKFFDSLPTIIYIAAPAQDNNAFIRFSRITRLKLPDKHFAKFLMTPSKDPVSVLSWQGNSLPAQEAGVPEINVKAILRVEKKRETYQPSEGLRTLVPEMGIITWTLLSAPTLAVERGFKFYNDTFAIIDAAAQIEQWKITLFYQDRRKKDGYKTIPYFLTSGRDTAVPAASPQAAPAQPIAPTAVSVVQPAVPATTVSPVGPALMQPAASAPMQPTTQPSSPQQITQSVPVQAISVNQQTQTQPQQSQLLSHPQQQPQAQPQSQPIAVQPPPQPAVPVVMQPTLPMQTTVTFQAK